MMHCPFPRFVTLPVLFSAVLFGGVSCHHLTEVSRAQPERVLPCTGLTLQGQVGPFAVYTKAGDANEFAIFRGQDCLMSRLQEGTNNVWETTHFEQGRSLLVTKADESHALIERLFSARNGSGVDTFSYIDTDGDGRWDLLLDFKSRQKFVRQGLTWVPLSPAQQK